MKIMNSLLKGSALSTLAGMLALTVIPTTAATQERERGERPRFERQAPREARSFRPEASRPARQEHSMEQGAARVMIAPPQVQQVQARSQRTEQSRPRSYERPPQPTNVPADDRATPGRDNSSRGFALDPRRTERADAEPQWTRQDRRNARQESEQVTRGDARDERREDRRDYRHDRRNGGFALDPNRHDSNNRNRTYRDGYRDGRYSDRRDDWRDNRDSYRHGYRDGRHADYSNHRRWDRRWRDNHRYDWYGYRNYNRNTYRLGRYYSPYYGYRYRRLNIGFTLDNLFFGSRYWINDPWQYRLPEVYGPYRWVRYYDDVLLVNTYTGEVVDVIYDFFW